MKRVEYVGLKPRKMDNVAWSGAVWHGQGDVQVVSDETWNKLSRHPDVWKLADEEGEAKDVKDTKTAEVKKPEPVKYELQHADGSVLDLGALDDAALAAFVKDNGLTIPAKKKGDALRAAIVEAVKASAAGA
jgi:hypothetical protein